MKALLLVLALATPIFAQESNVHVSGVIGTNANLGFANPMYGVSGGGDFRVSNKVVLSADGSVLRLKKNVGGSGYQVTAKETVRVYLTRKAFVQAATRQWKYDVRDFGKSGIEIGGGGGFMWEGEDQAGVFAVNYLHNVYEVQRPSGVDSKQQIVDGELRFYFKKHIFLSPRVAVSRFKSGGTSMTGASFTLQIGLWKKL